MKVKGTVTEVTQHDGYQTCTVENVTYNYEECLVHPDAKNMVKGDNVYVGPWHLSNNKRNRGLVAQYTETAHDFSDDLFRKYIGLPVKTSRFKAFMKWIW